MTFRPSVLPDRDNDILSTFVRSFERARQQRRADQADSRAQGEFNARQEDREAQKQDRILQANLEVSSRPELSFDRTFEINQELPGTRAQVTAETPGGGRQTIAEALGPDLQTTREVEGELQGRAPGGQEIFFSEEAGVQGREREARRTVEFERELDEPARLEQAEATAAERRDLDAALAQAGVPIEERRVLVRDPPAARQRLQSISAQAGRDTGAAAARGAGETGGERTRASRIQDVIARAREVGKPVTEAQAGIFADNPSQFQDFLRPIPEARQEQISEDLDRMQDVLDDIESDELTNPEKLERKKRALIDGGFGGTAEAFGTMLERFQDARREARELAGTFLEPVAQPGAGPAEESGLGGDEPRATINSTQIPGIAAAIEDLNFADRNDAIDRLAPAATALDRAAIMRAAGPAPTLSR